ncbi:unnamed protein product [Euphydryas editha]|uniref:dihydrofolate reductase n=1 Tax=Euphydryas editha TaxID=104508 RepID=A0AAU9TCZ5_EUPED|nr:unnamed protein product [Euphydryas editha]
MSKVKLNLIAAACENMGIGVNGTLPWRLKKEMAFFNKMTTKVKDPAKTNAIIMGRKTWDSIPNQFRPLNKRVNIVLTSQVNSLKENVSEEVIVVPSLDEAIEYINGRPDIESTWVIGGSYVYKAAIEHPNCDKIYLTEIQNTFNCDIFFPNIDKQKFHLIEEDGVPTEKQTEGDISYYFRIYKRL